MIKTTALIALCFVPGAIVLPQTSVQAGNVLYAQVLSDYVHNGLVDYEELCKDGRLGEWIEILNATDPQSITDRDDRLAFWINVYNAYTLKIVCDNYPVESIVDIGFGGLILGQVLGTTVWHKDLVTVNHKTMSLNNVEHDTIRGTFHEPRIHFALVCAAQSCPPLRNEAYEGAKLDAQLDDQGRKFLNDPSKNWFDLKNKGAHISKVFDWYGSDFGDSDAQILLFLSRYLPDDVAQSIRNDADAWSVSYTEYDWNLNDMNPK